MRQDAAKNPTTHRAVVTVRQALPSDIPALMRLKRSLAQAEDSLHAVRASEIDWLRDGFGPNAGFTAFVAEIKGASGDGIVGMATFSKRTITGWNGPVLFLQDLYVESAHRKHGVARALMARVAAYARDLGSPIVELTVRADNPAQGFYRRAASPPCRNASLTCWRGPRLPRSPKPTSPISRSPADRSRHSLSTKRHAGGLADHRPGVGRGVPARYHGVVYR